MWKEGVNGVNNGSEPAFSWKSQENYGKPLSEYLMTGKRFEPTIIRIAINVACHSSLRKRMKKHIRNPVKCPLKFQRENFTKRISSYGFQK
jgi:hypothetical protein